MLAKRVLADAPRKQRIPGLQDSRLEQRGRLVQRDPVVDVFKIGRLASDIGALQELRDRRLTACVSYESQQDARHRTTDLSIRVI